MPYLRRLVLLGLLLAALVPSSAVAGASVAPWIHQRGGEFVDGRGRIVQLRGVNANSTNLLYRTADTVGANVLRLPVRWSVFEPQPPVDGVHTYDTTALADLDTAVAWAQAHRINVLIDIHQWRWSPYFGNVLPGGASGMPGWLYTGYPVTQAGRLRAIWDFYTDPATIGDYRAFLTMLVKRYRSYPNVFGFEVLNEPPRGRDPASGLRTRVPTILGWEATMARLVWSLDRYRSAFFMFRDSGFYGFKTYGVGAFPSRARLAIDVHDYFAGRDHYASTLTSTPYVGTFGNQLGWLGRAMQYTRLWKIPLLVGEWGAPAGDPGLLVYQRQMLRAFQLCGVNASRWQVAPSNTGLLNPDETLTTAGRQLQEAYAQTFVPGMRLGCLR